MKIVYKSATIIVRNLSEHTAADHHAILSFFSDYWKLLVSYAMRIFVRFCHRRFEISEFVIRVEMSNLAYFSKNHVSD